jgi:hypothetical protein
VEIGVLVGGNNGDIVDASMLENEALEAVVQPKSAGAGSGGHEEGTFVRVDVSGLQ